MQRTAVVVVLLLAAAVVVPAVAQDRADRDRVRMLHLTVDSLDPDEVDERTPTLSMLRDQGIWYEQARAVMASETLPNHVAMGTGTYPECNGIPGNTERTAAAVERQTAIIEHLVAIVGARLVQVDQRDWPRP